MLGALLKTTIEARVRRERLIAEASLQRERMGTYLDALDPASRLLERVLGAIKFLAERPVIPAGILAAIVILKPKRAIKVGVLAWKAMSWIKRAKTAFR